MKKNIYVQEIARTTWYHASGPRRPRRMSSRSSKSGYSTIILIVAIFSVFGLVACNGGKNASQEPIAPSEQVNVDSLAVALHEVDSILNSGQLAHLDVYEIGKIKNVSVSVQKATAGDWETIWINFRKDCGGEYYYSWEDARLLYDECQYFINAINTIHSNRERIVDHEERYAYMTKDDIRIFAYAKSGNAWTVELSVDYHKQNSTITLNSSDVEGLINLIQKAQVKVNEIK